LMLPLFLCSMRDLIAAVVVRVISSYRDRESRR
jgi:hypothetical protein